MTDLQKEFEATGYTSWINADLYPDGKIYTQEYTQWLERQVLALRQPLVSGSLPLVSRDELISSLEDKRLCNMSNLPADIYYLSRKETADYLMDNYVITKRQ